ncbi:MAG TPA: S8 family serine peptidase, partial [Candidatus Thermoplasmatota archaeon]|nr:S8 family serine peptidase [Candidatus Thermoplasmatota archaeon]
MKSVPCLILCAAMLAPLALAADVPKLDEVEVLLPPAGTRYVVGFHEMVDTSSGQYAGERIVDFDATLRFVTVESMSPATFEARARTDPNVRYVEVEQTYQAFWTPNDPFWPTSDYQWGAKQIGAALAWDKTRGSTGVKLCIIDSGLYKSHEEFAGLARVAQGYDFVFEDTDPNDPNGHGTHVAGIASAQEGNSKGMAGIAKVTLVPVRVLDSAGSGTTTDVAQGFRYARDIGCHIASASLGGGASTTIQDAVVYAQNGGVLVIAAAGNDGCACVRYPAGYSGVLGVGATDKSNAKASFSNTGSHVDIAAPGVSIVSTYKTISGCTTNCYVYLDGISMATPYVSGVAALVKSYNAGLTASQISSRLTGTAQDLGAAGYDS